MNGAEKKKFAPKIPQKFSVLLKTLQNMNALIQKSAGNFAKINNLRK